jgi:hypothetical protein
MKQLSDYNFFEPEVIECPYDFYKLAREQAPVMELPQLTSCTSRITRQGINFLANRSSPLKRTKSLRNKDFSPF